MFCSSFSSCFFWSQFYLSLPLIYYKNADNHKNGLVHFLINIFNIAHFRCLDFAFLILKAAGYNFTRLYFQVPAVLQNKAILSRYGSSIRAFVSPLIELTNHSSKYPENLTHTEEVEKKKLTRPELHNQVQRRHAHHTAPEAKALLFHLVCLIETWFEWEQSIYFFAHYDIWDVHTWGTATPIFKY